MIVKRKREELSRVEKRSDGGEGGDGSRREEREEERGEGGKWEEGRVKASHTLHYCTPLTLPIFVCQFEYR